MKDSTRELMTKLTLEELDLVRQQLPKPNLTQKLFSLASEQYDFGVTPGQDPYVVRKGEIIAHRLRGGGGGLRSVLLHTYQARTGDIPRSGSLSDAVAAVEAAALQQEPAPTYLRFAPDPDDPNGIYIDLANHSLGDSHALHVTSRGWELTDQVPVRFHRASGMKAMPIPLTEGNGGTAALRQLLNIKGEDWPLLLAWMVSVMIPGMPNPILNFKGEQGTGKSTAARLIRTIVDPSTTPWQAANINNWPVVASEFNVVALDNISYISAEFSDMLCRAVTGDGEVRRKLYSDGGLITLQFMNSIIMTSIDAGSLRGDLADRLLFVELDTIEPHARITDKAIKESFGQNQELIFTGIVELLSHVLAVLPSVELEALPRMADFAQVVAAVDMVLGTDALGTYLDQAEDVSGQVLDGDPMFQVIKAAVIDSGGVFKGSSSDLLKLINDRRGVHDFTIKHWPSSANSLSGLITRLGPAMKKQHWAVEKTKSGSQRFITLTAPQGI